MSKVAHRLLPLLLLTSALGGCGVVGSVKHMLGLGPPRPALRTLTVSADPGANLGGATALDIVVAYSQAAASSLPKTGPEWFRQRAALQSALAKEIAVVSLQVPSASAAFKVKLPRDTRKKGLAIYAFANYAAKEGWPIIALAPYSHVALRLQADSIDVSGK